MGSLVVKFVSDLPISIPDLSRMPAFSGKFLPLLPLLDGVALLTLLLEVVFAELLGIGKLLTVFVPDLSPKIGPETPFC